MNPVQQFFQHLFLSITDALGLQIHNGSSAIADIALMLGWF